MDTGFSQRAGFVHRLRLEAPSGPDRIDISGRLPFAWSEEEGATTPIYAFPHAPERWKWNDRKTYLVAEPAIGESRAGNA